MKQSMKDELSRLNASYKAIVGRPFQHFYCPVLFRDEDTKLCKAHIINKTFRNSDKQWTIQRKDVDGFYGRIFESDFEIIQERGKYHPLDVLTNKKLSRKLRPKVVINGEHVEHYVPNGEIPVQHSLVIIGDNENQPQYAFKVSPDKIIDSLDGNWEIHIERDVRLAALPSLLKAAHLTLFKMLGYQYGLSLAGHFVGHDILGRFFIENHDKPKVEVLENAYEHFSEYINMVRPILPAPPEFEGTLSDRRLFLCMSGKQAWAFLILIKTGELLHAVLAPVFDDAENSARYLRFLKKPPATLEATFAQFTNDGWGISPNSNTFKWPDANWL